MRSITVSVDDARRIYHTALVRRAAVLVGNEVDAEVIVQEVFKRVSETGGILMADSAYAHLNAAVQRASWPIRARTPGKPTGQTYFGGQPGTRPSGRMGAVESERGGQPSP